MNEWQTSLSRATLAKLEGLELRAKQVVDGLLAGRHRSHRRGFSTEFAEHREYTPGDDPRYLDWKVYGRTDRFYLKVHEEETNLACYVVLDCSRSMQYRSERAELSKWEVALVLAASLAYVVLRQQDAAGLVTVDADVRRLIQPSSNPAQWRKLIETLEAESPNGLTALGPCLQLVAERIRRRSVVVVISDLFDELDSLVRGLKHLHSRRHDVSVLQVVDPQEVEFDFRQMTLFHGLEDGRDTVVDAPAIRRAYLQEFNEFVDQVRRACHELHVDFEQIRTDQPLHLALAGFLRHRAERVVRV